MKLSQIIQNLQQFRSNRPRHYIIPTRFGGLYLLTTIAILLTGAIYSNNLVYMLGFFLLAMSLVAMVLTNTNLKSVVLESVQVEEAFAGEELRIWIYVHNNSKSDISSQLEFWIEDYPTSNRQMPLLRYLPASSSTSLLYTTAAPLRGRHRIQRIRCSTAYPLGLFWAWTWLNCKPEHEFIIYPDRQDPTALPRSLQAQSQKGESSQGSEGDDFTGHRRFESGDSARHIDWKAVARGRPLSVKEFRSGEPEILHLDWDELPPQLPTEERASRLTSWVEKAHQQQLRYSLSLSGKTLQIGPTQGQGIRKQALTALATHRLNTTDNDDKTKTRRLLTWKDFRQPTPLDSLPLSKHLQFMLLFATLLNLLPFSDTTPIWMISICLFILLWKGLLLAQKTAVPSRLVLHLLQLFSAAAVFFHYRSFFNLETAAALLLFASAFKLLETQVATDCIKLILILFFNLTIYLLNSEGGLSPTIFMLFDLLLLTNILFQIQTQERRLSLRAFRPSFKLLLTAIPIWLFFFVAFPRITIGSWGISKAGKNNSSSAAARSGFQNEVNPGDISKLAQSEEIVFRASLHNSSSLEESTELLKRSPENLYWRGGVLQIPLNGLHWKRLDKNISSILSARAAATGATEDAASKRHPSSTSSSPNEAGRELRDIAASSMHWAQIILEAGYGKSLFVLDYPLNVQIWMAGNLPSTTNPESITKQRNIASLQQQLQPQRAIASSFEETTLTYELKYENNNRLIYQQSFIDKNFKNLFTPPNSEIDLKLPEKLAPQVVQLAKEIKAKTQDTTTHSYRDSVLSWFREQNFRYTREPGALQGDQLVDFLFVKKRGFCEHYAASFALLMRLLGVPARVVVGFMGASYNEFGGYYAVRELDAHAWTEIWNSEEELWERVDPTTFIAPMRASVGADMFLNQNTIGNALSLPFIGQLSMGEWFNKNLLKTQMLWDAASLKWNQFLLTFDETYQENLLEKLGWNKKDKLLFFVLSFVSLLLFIIGFRLFLQIRKPKNTDPIILSYMEFCDVLSELGYPRRLNEGPLEYSRRMQKIFPDLNDKIGSTFEYFIKLRYQSQASYATHRHDIKSLRLNLKILSQDLRRSQQRLQT